MLEKLGDIKWSQLTHAYGSAEDVPGIIAGLASENEALREKSYDSAYYIIFHQGTRYQASAAAIPFLFELLQDSSVPQRERLIYLLVHLAVGYPESYLPEGVDFEEHFLPPLNVRENKAAAIEAYCKLCEDAELTPEESELADSAGWIWHHECFLAVARQADVFIDLLSSGEPRISVAALYALAFFPEHAQKSMQSALAAYHWKEISAEVRCSALLCLGTLSRYLAEPDCSLFVAYLNDGDRIVSLAASIALLNCPRRENPDAEQRALQIVLRDIRDPKYIKVLNEKLPWKMTALCVKVLAALKPQNPGSFVSAIGAAIRADKPRLSYDLLNALLELTFSSQIRTKSNKGRIERSPKGGSCSNCRR